MKQLMFPVSETPTSRVFSVEKPQMPKETSGIAINRNPKL
jgi:hypothetical protein